MRNPFAACLKLVVCSVAVLTLAGTPAHAGELDESIAFNIPVQSLETALLELSRQSAYQIVFSSGSLPNRSAPRISGKMQVRQALDRLLSGTELGYKLIGERTITVGRGVALPTVERPVETRTDLRREAVNLVLADKAGPEQAGKSIEKTATRTGENTEENSGAVPELLVKGSRTLNTDIKRTEDDQLPYVVFESEEIANSQATNVEDFLRTRLPMSTTSQVVGQNTGTGSTFSLIDLRGLGTKQTLILLDGRRMPSNSAGGSPFQPDLNGIPMAAIERIEVLPSTAGGIYGGSATGGVINIILRRDFQGVDVKATYANTFDSDTGNMRLDANAGFSLEEGRTHITLAASHSDANNLLVGDRDFAQRMLDVTMRNNPASIIGLNAPPMGETVNIRGAAGALLVLDDIYGGTPLGSNITNVPLGYAGPASDSGAGLVRNAGKYNLAIPAGMNGRDRGLLAASSIESLAANVRREFGEHFEAFLDLSRLVNAGLSFTAGVPNSVLNLPASAPNNPFKQAINVRFPTPGISFDNRATTTTLRGTAGLIFRLPGGWNGELDHGWSQVRYVQSSATGILDSVGNCVILRGVGAGSPSVTGAAPCRAGDTRPALNILQEGNTFPVDYSPYMLPMPNLFNGPYDTVLKDTTLRVSGTVLDLPGGRLGISALVERRQETIEDGIFQNLDPISRLPLYFFYPQSSQRADSYYVEARAPLLRPLELQVSVRRDEYITISNPEFSIPIATREDEPTGLVYTTNRTQSTDYTVGLRYTLSQDLTMRASFGTGFIPPDVTQIAPTFEVLNVSLGADPKRNGDPMFVDDEDQYLIDYVSGGNPTIKPERSKSFSAGLIYTPRVLSDLRFSLDYTRLKKVDEIQFPLAQLILDKEDELPGRIRRAPRRPEDPSTYAGPIVFFDQTYINIANTTIEVLDLQIDYTVNTARSGEFHWYGIATKFLHSENQVVPELAPVDRVGFAGGPLDFRGSAGLNWRMGQLALNWNAQYYNAYRVYSALASPATLNLLVLNQGAHLVRSQIYNDLIGSYRFDGAAGSGWMGAMLADSEISVGIQNVFNAMPPLQMSTSQVAGGYSTYGDPRMRRYTVSFRKSFGRL